MGLEVLAMETARQTSTGGALVSIVGPMAEHVTVRRVIRRKLEEEGLLRPG